MKEFIAYGKYNTLESCGQCDNCTSQNQYKCSAVTESKFVEIEARYNENNYSSYKSLFFMIEHLSSRNVNFNIKASPIRNGSNDFAAYPVINIPIAYGPRVSPLFRMDSFNIEWNPDGPLSINFLITVNNETQPLFGIFEREDGSRGMMLDFDFSEAHLKVLDHWLALFVGVII